MENERAVLRQRPSRNENVEVAIGTSSIVKYTEDGIPILNLIIKELPRNLTRKDIIEHFWKYGSIKNIELTYGNNRNQPNVCVIRFKEKESAGRALTERDHFIKYKRVVVKACPSWEQHLPLTNLIEMSYYCHVDIFKELDLQQQVRWALFDTRSQDIFTTEICPHLPHLLNLEALKHFTAWELNQFFKSAGPYLHSIIVGTTSGPYQHLIQTCDLIRGNCSQVSALTVISRSDIFEPFINTLNPVNVTELDLFNCNLVDANVKILQKFPNLQSLGLAYNNNITGDGLQYLRKLQRLGLCNCENIADESLALCFRACKLRYLDMRWTLNLPDVTRNIGCCNELESLKISLFQYVPLRNIMMLPNLKRLEVNFSTAAMEPNDYRQLAAYHARDLVELKITGSSFANIGAAIGNILRLQALRVLWLGGNQFNCSPEIIRQISDMSELEEISLYNAQQLRDDDLCRLVKKCKKLRRIDVRGCREITEEFVWRAIPVLRNRIGELEQPLTLLVFETEIEKLILMIECLHRKLANQAQNGKRNQTGNNIQMDAGDTGLRWTPT